MTALVPILAVTLFVIIRRPTQTPAPAEGEPATVTSKATVVPSAVEIDWELPSAYELARDDPMSPKLSSPVQMEELPMSPQPVRETVEVKGVLFSEDRPAAIIGTRLVHEGDQIAGATVVGIDREGVEFERDGQTWRQTVSPDQGTR
jgi:hypothetical protein